MCCLCVLVCACEDSSVTMFTMSVTIYIIHILIYSLFLLCGRRAARHGFVGVLMSVFFFGAVDLNDYCTHVRNFCLLVIVR